MRDFMRTVFTVKARQVLAAGIGAFAVLQVLDIVTTSLLLSNGGFELNPLARAAYAANGVPALIAIKVLGLTVLGCLFAAMHTYTRHNKPEWIPASWGVQAGAVWAGVAWFSFVVLNNMAAYGGLA